MYTELLCKNRLKCRKNVIKVVVTGVVLKMGGGSGSSPVVGFGTSGVRPWSSIIAVFGVLFRFPRALFFELATCPVNYSSCQCEMSRHC
jgi:hypothetical protein